MREGIEDDKPRSLLQVHQLKVSQRWRAPRCPRAERVAIAEEIRRAGDCALCAERHAALSEGALRWSRILD